MPSTVLFDLDGTLIDHFRAIHRCHCHTLRTLGLPKPTPEQVRAAVGGGLENAIARLAGKERLAEALPIYRKCWDATMLDDVELMPGARELLERLRSRGHTTAVLTNKHGDSARRVCERLGLAPLLAAVVGAGDTPWLKPDPRLTDQVLRTLSADRAAAVLVGDSPYDLATAVNAGIAFLAVTTGTHDESALRQAGATSLFPSLLSLQDLPLLS